MTNPKILIIGANPAYQKNLLFKNFISGKVNRANSSNIYASGKGINFLKAAKNSDIDGTLMQFAGGCTGNFIVDELNKKQINHQTIKTNSTTRCCTTCIDENSQIMTEIIEPSGTITKEEFNNFFTILKTIVSDYDAIAVCGTCPGTIGEEFYREITKISGKQQNQLLFFDAYIDTKKALTEKNIDIIKINRHELFNLTLQDDITEALKLLHQEYAIKIVAITDGADGAWLSDGKNIFFYELPKLKNIKNPLGAGDTASAIFLAQILHNKKASDAFKNALAAASASCLKMFCADFSQIEAKKIKSLISVRKKTFLNVNLT